ncbi:MAG TPA: 50S ribosomal protein L11 methyltransferase [Myxococcota bacterium]|nr:50S ribosomal protein L11 methyltransferase [Myxococcota bacterium]HRY92734.1 50S ribosomal protein L11 methyltransferase [Myxococcota bacterium]HSA20724.1 50S ribosomal protein L11 methyltransferase [Myxococcota bacterium]
MSIEYHRKLLGDEVRNRAFHEALAASIAPGETVMADVGAGTGLLSFLALQLGARKSYLIEAGPVLALARKLAGQNRQKGCVFVPGHSSEVELPEKVDLVVSETLGNFPYEEHLLENLADARRFLKPRGRLLPMGLRVFAQPLASARLLAEVDVWSRVGFGLELGPARELGLNNMYVKAVRPDDLLGGPGGAREIDRVELSRPATSQRVLRGRWELPEGGRAHGFGLWWAAELSPGVHLSTGPWDPPTHWEQIFLPLRAPLLVEPGEALELELRSDSRWKVGLRVAWTARVLDARGRPRAEDHLSIDKGDLERVR